MRRPTLDIVRENPVLVKELRSRMRGGRAYWMLAAYLALLGLVFFIVYMQWWAQARHAGAMGGPWQAGRAFYWAVFATQAALLTLIAPAVTAGAITIEREQRTFEMLVVTRLRPVQIVVGKLLSSTLFLAVLLTTSLPLAAICLLFGGVAPSEILMSYLALLAAACVLGSVGILWSSAVGRSIGATLLSFGSILGWMLGSAIGLAYVYGGLSWRSSPLIAANPFFVIAEVAEAVDIFGLSVPVAVLAAALYLQAGCLLATLAVAKVEHFRTDKALSARLQLAAAVLVWLTVGFAAVWAGASGTGQATAIAWLPLIVLGLLVPPLCSAVPEGPGARSFAGFLMSGVSRRIFSQRGAGGLTFAVGLGAVAMGYALVLLGVWGRQSGDVLVPLALVFLLAVVVQALVCAVCAWAARRRAAGMIAGYGFIFVTWVLAPLSLAAWEGYGSYHLIHETVYLCPYVAFWQAIDPSWWTAANLPIELLAGTTPPWIVTSAVYAILAVGLVAAGEFIARTRRVQG